MQEPGCVAVESKLHANELRQPTQDKNSHDPSLTFALESKLQAVNAMQPK